MSRLCFLVFLQLARRPSVRACSSFQTIQSHVQHFNRVHWVSRTLIYSYTQPFIQLPFVRVFSCTNIFLQQRVCRFLVKWDVLKKTDGVVTPSYSCFLHSVHICRRSVSQCNFFFFFFHLLWSHSRDLDMIRACIHAWCAWPAVPLRAWLSMTKFRWYQI